MADTFFGFDTTLNNGDHLLPPDEDDDDDDCLEDNGEEEYDALNDETFGGSGDNEQLDDWEQQHEQFAEITESGRHHANDDDDDDDDGLDQEAVERALDESAISALLLDDDVDEGSGSKDTPITSLTNDSVWAYTPPPNRNGDIFNSSILSTLQKASKSFIEGHKNEHRGGFEHLPISPIQPTPSQIRTVEELEKNLIKKTSTNQQHHQHLPLPPPTQRPIIHQNATYPHPYINQSRMPPLLRHPHLPPPHHNMPPRLAQMLPLPPPPPPGHYPLLPLQQRPPGFLYPHHHHPHHPPPFLPYGFPPPLHHPPPPPQSQSLIGSQQLSPQQRHTPIQQRHHKMAMKSTNQSGDIYQSRPRPEPKDEYAGLMTNREKQWLLNIQLLQLNTGTPYFDDYYFTVFKERRAKGMIMTSSSFKDGMGRGRVNNNNSTNQKTNGDGNNGQTLTSRIYTPLQFENSLGKLQWGSVTAPRKIIDMDIVAPETTNQVTANTSAVSVLANDTPTTTSTNSRRIRQLLLELEALYTLLLKAEDIKNPIAIQNVEKLRELRQKQRLRELELAPTPEQKQEVLRLFKLESEPIVEDQQEQFEKIVHTLLNDERFNSYMNIRKGKMLLVRLMPHLLSNERLHTHLSELWSKVLNSLIVVGRRDMAGDQILPKLHPYFKKYIQSCMLDGILELVQGLMRGDPPSTTTNRATPSVQSTRPPLHFVLINRFGVSALVTLFVRYEWLLSSGIIINDEQRTDWLEFLQKWAELTKLIGIERVATPIETIPIQTYKRHTKRFNGLDESIWACLETHFVDV